MAGTILDSSIRIQVLAGTPIAAFEEAEAQGALILAPLVVAELISGANRPADRVAIGELLQDAPVHETPLDHWIRVGELRRLLKTKGVNVTIPDAHVAQCALDRDAVLLTRDRIFERIARVTRLRLSLS